MDFILKLKHWQVFLIFLGGSFLINFTWINEDVLTLIFNIIGLLIYFFWYFSVGLELTEHLPPRIELPKTFFIINSFVILISIAILIIVFDGEFSTNGLIGFLWIIYLCYAFFQFMFFPSKALKSIELGNKAKLGDYFGYFLLTVFWPIGIWIIQPKLNKINKEEGE
jgi:hypothetical protein